MMVADSRRDEGTSSIRGGTLRPVHIRGNGRHECCPFSAESFVTDVLELERRGHCRHQMPKPDSIHDESQASAADCSRSCTFFVSNGLRIEQEGVHCASA